MMIKLTAMTTLCVDLFPESGEIRPGGEALNLAAVASEYDHMSVSIIGCVGNDNFAEHILDSIKNKKIDKQFIHVDKSLPTASHKIYLTDKGDRYFKADSWNGGAFEKFKLTCEDKKEICKCDVVFITYSSPNFNEVLALRKDNNFKLAVDFNVERDFEKLYLILPYIDFFLISGEQELLPTFKDLSTKFDGFFNVTLAQNGSVTYKNGEEFRVNALKVDNVVDTTGCGDSYHAGFLCSYFKDFDIIKAMNEGSKTASETLSHIGGFAY